MIQLKISPDDLMNMDDHAHLHHFRVDLAYARDNNRLFSERLYRKDAQLYLHQKLAQIVLMAAKRCFEEQKLRFVLYDGLRTTDAQEAMMKTRRVSENPHWLEPPRLLSRPGGGGHPRAMAVDIGLEDSQGQLIDMGCPFDYLCENPHADANPAHRDYLHPAPILKNREILNAYMRKAAEHYDTELILLAEEWWDFRLSPEFFGSYAPLRDKDLPEEMRLTDI